MAWSGDQSGVPRWVQAIYEARRQDSGPSTPTPNGLRRADPSQDQSVQSMDSHLLRLHRSKLQQQLALAEQHVADGAKLIAKQRQTLGELESSGYDSEVARATLKQYEELQKLHLADQERLRNELALWREPDPDGANFRLAPT